METCYFSYDGNDLLIGYTNPCVEESNVAFNDDNEKFKYRKEYSVALFHQKPEIHDCLEHDIVKDNWI